MSQALLFDEPLSREGGAHSADSLPVVSFLGLPLEIRTLVLEQILVCAAPLSLSPGWCSGWPCFRPLRKRLGIRHYEKCYGSQAVVLHYTRLWGVSRQLRSEARAIFFSRNRWVFHITSRLDSVLWGLDDWGKEALRMMSDIRIVARSVDSADVQLVRTRLEGFVDVLIPGNKLRRLAVQWIWGPEILAHTGKQRNPVPRVDRDHDTERQADGTRGVKRIIVNPAGRSSNNPYAGYVGGGKEAWVENEKVLTPLHKLKGIQARIEGCVTDEWALWLEESMAATQGSFGEFVRTKDVKQAEMEMMEAIRLKNRWDMDWLQLNRGHSPEDT